MILGLFLLMPFAVIWLIYLYQCWVFDRRCSKLPEATPYRENVVRVPKYKVRNYNKVMEKFKQRQNGNN